MYLRYFFLILHFPKPGITPQARQNRRRENLGKAAGVSCLSLEISMWEAQSTLGSFKHDSWPSSKGQDSKEKKGGESSAWRICGASQDFSPAQWSGHSQKAGGQTLLLNTAAWAVLSSLTAAYCNTEQVLRCCLWTQTEGTEGKCFRNKLTTVDLLTRGGKWKNPGCLTPAAWQKMRAPKGWEVSQTGGYP